MRDDEAEVPSVSIKEQIEEVSEMEDSKMSIFYHALKLLTDFFCPTFDILRSSSRSPNYFTLGAGVTPLALR